MQTSVLSGLLCFLPIAIIMLLATGALIFVSVLLFKRGNKPLAIVILLFAFLPFVIFLIFFVMLIIYVLESVGVM